MADVENRPEVYDELQTWKLKLLYRKSLKDAEIFQAENSVPLVYVQGDVTKPIGSPNYPRIVVHCCNDAGLWGAGVSGAIGNEWTVARKQYYAWAKTDSLAPNIPFKIGNIQAVCVHETLYVCNLIGQRGVRSPINPKPVDYPGIKEGLTKLALWANTLFGDNAVVHMPKLGAGLAGGDWDIIEGIIKDTLGAAGIFTVVYEFGGGK